MSLKRYFLPVLSLLIMLMVVSETFAQQRTLQVNMEFKVEKGLIKAGFTALKKEATPAPAMFFPLGSEQSGEFRVDLISSRLKGSYFFSSLAGEWAQMCHGDSCKLTVFEESLKLPLPVSVFKLFLYQRDPIEGKWHLLDSMRSDSRKLLQVKALIYKAKHFSPVQNGKHGLDLMFVPDGYGNDTVAYYSACQRFLNALYAESPFDTLKRHVHAFAVFYPSDTASICSFNTLGMPRYLAVKNRMQLARRVAGIYADHVVVIARSSIYGGSGFYNNYAVVSSDNRLSEKVFVHEFGHSFGGLGDEYNTDNDLCAIPKPGVDVFYPNISAMPDGKIKWAQLIEPGTPIPTPSTPEFKDKVGAFVGASYCPSGLYRPVDNCLMRTLTPGHFCPVCRLAIWNVIKKY